MPLVSQNYDNYHGAYFKTASGHRSKRNSQKKWRANLMRKYNCNISKALIIHKYANQAKAKVYGQVWQHLRSKDAYVVDWFAGGKHLYVSTLGEVDRMTIAELEKTLKEIQAHIDKSRR